MRAVFCGSDLVQWFREHYPLVKETTVRAHITAATVNLSSRTHYPGAHHDLLFKRSDRRLERYDPARHGLWKEGQPVSGAVARTAGDLVDESRAENQEPSEELAEALAQAFGGEFESAVVALTGGVTQRFDLVGTNGAVGAHPDRDGGKSPTERWKAISEAVWLLQHLEEPGPRFPGLNQ